MRGKIQLYKRATLYLENQPPEIIDYTDGTLYTDADVVVNGGQPFYIWELPGKTVTIPLNVGRYDTNSIIEQGTIPFRDGYIEYEFIYGKYYSPGEHFMVELARSLPLAVVILVLFYLAQRIARH